MGQRYRFGEEFRRKILAQAIRGDLLRTSKDTFKAKFFSEGKKTFSPQQRLASLVEKFAKTNRGERPGVITMDELVKEEARRLGTNEAKALKREWRGVRSIKIPDPRYVTSKVREFAQEAALASAVMDAAELIDQARLSGDQVDATRIRSLIDSAMQVGQADSVRRGYLLKDAAMRMVRWGEDDTRRRIPTGLKTLDGMLSGGPSFGEVFYVLAEPKGAKSCFLLNVALGAIRRRHSVAFFSYEMRWEKMLMRMDQNVSRMTKVDLKTGSGLSKLERSMKGLTKAGVGEIVVQEFNSRQHGCAEAARVVEELRGYGLNIDLIVLDYLNIMGSGGRGERRHEIADISRQMSFLGKETDTLIWSAALVNRAAVEKAIITKTDIAEAFEVIAILDGAVAICGDKGLREAGMRGLYLTALREEEDERLAGIYRVDRARMKFFDVTDEVLGAEEMISPDDVEALPAADLR